MLTIAVDFDGTIVDHDLIIHNEPRIGKPVPYALDYLRTFQDLDAKIILWTMRSEVMNGQNHIDIAVDYLTNNGIRLYGINRNPEQHWTLSPKVYADVVIDDIAFGCPLIHYDGFVRPCVNWGRVGPDIVRTLKNIKRQQS